MGNFHELDIFRTLEKAELKLSLYEIFLCEIVPGCVPKHISLIWPNSGDVEVAVHFENFMCHDANWLTVIVVVRKDGVRMIQRSAWNVRD